MKIRLFVLLTWLVSLIWLALSLTTAALPVSWAQTNSSSHFIYVPLVPKPHSADLTITGLEVIQSIQKANNSVPLVANRPTTVRVFAQTIAGPAPGGVTVSLTATRNGVPLGTVNSTPGIIPTTTSRDNYNSTFNLALPAAWLSGNINLVAMVDANNGVPELNEANNTVAVNLNFTNMPPLQVVVVPINYTHTGSLNPGFYPAQAVDNISDWIMRAYPVHQVAVTFRAPYNFTGNLQGSQAWSNLLDAMYTLKLADGLPEDTPKVYYAFVPINNGSTTWFQSGIAGIGWIGFRESVGLNLGANDNSGTLAGHEIGHNLGRRHAPCGNPSGVDPNYPYVGASIGEYGLDIPHGIFWTPGTAVDLMSYCSPEWISDYTYTALYNDQLVHGLSVTDAPEPSLMIQATVDEAGSAVIRPVYTLAATAATRTDSSDYAIELVDAFGHVLAMHPAVVREAEEEGITIRAIQTVVPVPTTAVAGVRVVRSGVVVAERALNPAPAGRAATAQLSQSDDSITLRWSMPDTPAIVRYKADDGQSWTTVGLDVLGGQFTLEKGILPVGNGRFEIILADTMSGGVLTADYSPTSP